MSIFIGDARCKRYYNAALKPLELTVNDVTSWPTAITDGAAATGLSDLNSLQSGDAYPQLTTTPEGVQALDTVAAAQQRALFSSVGTHGGDVPTTSWSYFAYVQINGVPSVIYGAQPTDPNNDTGGVSATGYYQLANSTLAVTDLPYQSGWHLVHFRHRTDGASYVELRDGTKSAPVNTGTTTFSRTRFGSGNWYGPWATIKCGALLFWLDPDDSMTDQLAQDIFAQMEEDLGIVNQPYPGTHTVTNTDNATDPNCIYFGQGVKIGDTFSFKETTEINGWGVSIDADGYPIIDSGGATGTDSFLFDIDKGAGYVNPSEWTFTIGQPPVEARGSNVIGGAFRTQGAAVAGAANLEAFLVSEGWGTTRAGENFTVRSGVHEWHFTWSEAQAGVYESMLPAPLRSDIDDGMGR